MAINEATTTIVNGILSCLHSKASEIAETPILPTTCFKQFLCSSRLASTFGKSLSAVFVASSNSAWRDVESVITAISYFSLWSKTLHFLLRHIAFFSVIEHSPLLTKTVKINQSEGIPRSGIPEHTFVKDSYKRSRTFLPSPLLLSSLSSHRSPLSELLEQAKRASKTDVEGLNVINDP